MIIPANAYLGPRPPLERQPYGYSVLDIGRNVVAPFTADRVISPMLNWYAVEGGVTVPDGGGFIVWGTARQAVAEEAIAPMPQLPTQALINGIQAALRELGNRVAALIPPPPPPAPAPIVQMDTRPFVGAVSELRSELQAQLVHGQAAQAAWATTLGGELQRVAESVVGLATMREMVVAELTTHQQPIHVVNEISTEGLGAPLALIRDEIERVRAELREALATVQADEARRRTVAALDKFLDATGGQQ